MTVEDIVNDMSKYVDSNGNVDWITLTEILELIRKISGAIIDILVAVIIVGIPIVIAIEVCYINFPLFERKYEELYDRLKGKPQRILGLMIRDAQKAVKDSRTTEYGEGANSIYLKIKCKAIFICVFIIGLVLGAGPVLIKWGFVLVRSFMSVLNGML